MRKPILAVSLILPLLGSASPAAEGIEAELRGLLRQRGTDLDRVGIAVIDAQGKNLAAINADLPLKPASNLKVLTTLAAIEFLGPDFEFRTRIVATAPLQDGSIRGDVIVVGGGDPNISGRFYEDDPLRLLRTWGRRLRAAGLKTIEGDLLADDSFFDDTRFLPGWDPRFAGRWFSAEVSALSLNDNCIDVTVEPTRPGQPAHVEVEPASPFVQVAGAPQTTTGGAARVRIHRERDSNQVRILGTIGERVGPWKDHVAVHDPALFFVHSLARVLTDEGIAIRGRPARRARIAAAPPGVAGPPAAPEEHLLVEHRSSLRSDLAVINKRSQNLHAEMLLKTLGKERGGEGSAAGGGRVVARFLERYGVSALGLEIADGSGLAHENRVSASQLARSLYAVHRQSYFPLFLDSLPVGGQDGTLKERFGGHAPLAGRVFAKTGYIRGVSTLSGYLRRPDGLVAFAFLFNDLPGGLDATRKLQEELLARIDRGME
jgi:D-alanyl-D-alanine carboxypeptidase/D-alanyl-D-alanine-endopeptidase (penicillin-binding protein 4)